MDAPRTRERRGAVTLIKYQYLNISISQYLNISQQRIVFSCCCDGAVAVSLPYLYHVSTERLLTSRHSHSHDRLEEHWGEHWGEDWGETLYKIFLIKYLTDFVCRTYRSRAGPGSREGAGRAWRVVEWRHGGARPGPKGGKSAAVSSDRAGRTLAETERSDCGWNQVRTKWEVAGGTCAVPRRVRPTGKYFNTSEYFTS